MTARVRVEYLMEAALLGIFMISACAFVVLLEYPASPSSRSGRPSWSARNVVVASERSHT